MIWADRGGATQGVVDVRRSAPVVRVDRAALARNAEGHSGPGTLADLRADAWGHGATHVAQTVLRAGIDAVLTDERSAARLTAAGVAQSRIRLTGTATVDLHTLYGLPGSTGTPVMSLRGTVLSVKALLAGEGVSYGYTYRARSDTRVALVTGGYAQGVVRALGNRAALVIAGRRHPIVGRVAMDVCVVEVGESAVDRGDVAEFFGDPRTGAPSLAEWVAATGLTGAELVTAVGQKGQREQPETLP